MHLVVVIVRFNNQTNNRIMKTKVTKKSTKKDPAFIVNYTDIKWPQDVIVEVILAKVRSGVAITTDEARALVEFGADCALEAMEDYVANMNTKSFIIDDDEFAQKLLNMCLKKAGKKLPWYKKFWKWLTKPFRKNK